MKTGLRKKYDQMSPAVRTSVWFTFCQFLQRGIVVITVPVFTRLLATEEYGICNIYFTWFDLFLLFTSLKIPYEGLNNGLIRYEEDKDGYTSSILGLIMFITVGVSGIYLLFRRRIDLITGLNSRLMLLMFIQLIFQPPLMLWTNRERFDFRYRKPVMVTVVSTVLNLTVTVLAVMNSGYRAEARIVGSVFVQSLFGVILIAVLFWKGRTFYKKEYWNFALRFNLPLIFYYISQMVLNQSDRILINYFHGSGKAAVYSVAYSAATVMQLVLSAVNGSFHPWIYKKLKAGKFDEIKQTTSGVCILVGGAVFVVSVLAPDLVRIMATEEYMEAVWIIAPVSTSVFFTFLYMVFANVEMYYGETRGVSVISIICSVLNISLNIEFLPVFGYFAAGWTTLICYMLLTLFHYWMMKRICRRNNLTEHLFDERFLLIISIAVFIVSFAIMGLYQLGRLRYGVLLLMGILIFVFWRNLYAILKEM